VHRHVCLIGRRVLQGQLPKVGNHLEAATGREGGRNGVGSEGKRTKTNYLNIHTR
jgi:hypothetical protein